MQEASGLVRWQPAVPLLTGDRAYFPPHIWDFLLDVGLSLSLNVGGGKPSHYPYGVCHIFAFGGSLCLPVVGNKYRSCSHENSRNWVSCLELVAWAAGYILGTSSVLCSLPPPREQHCVQRKCAALVSVHTREEGTVMLGPRTGWRSCPALSVELDSSGNWGSLCWILCWERRTAAVSLR